MTLLDALQYLSLFANKKTKAYKCTKKQISTGKVYKSIKKLPKRGIMRMKKINKCKKENKSTKKQTSKEKAYETNESIKGWLWPCARRLC